MLREIRNLRQPSAARVKRWFQDEYFDLFVWQDSRGGVLRFQLCYARDTRRERALEWQRGGSFQHLRVRQRYDESRGREQSGEMTLTGAGVPHPSVRESFAAAADNLPARLRRFIELKLMQYAWRRGAWGLAPPSHPGP